MTATATQPEVTLDPGEQAASVERVPDQLRQEIVAARQNGATLAELKARFGEQVHMDVIRELLPPMNARERKAREAKAPKAETPKPAPEPHYATDLGDVADRVVAAREVLGRGNLAELLGVSGSACWRFEHGRVHPDELTKLRGDLVAVEGRIQVGEFVKPERAPKAKRLPYAELVHRIEVAVQLLGEAQQHAKGGTKVRGFIDQALDTLAPKPTEEPTS